MAVSLKMYTTLSNFDIRNRQLKVAKNACKYNACMIECLY